MLVHQKGLIHRAIHVFVRNEKNLWILQLRSQYKDTEPLSWTTSCSGHVDAGEGYLDAVFLTHEHNDHSVGIKGLSKFTNLPVFANRDTVQAVQPKLSRRPNWKIFETGLSLSLEI